MSINPYTLLYPRDAEPLLYGYWRTIGDIYVPPSDYDFRYHGVSVMPGEWRVALGLDGATEYRVRYQADRIAASWRSCFVFDVGDGGTEVLCYAPHISDMWFEASQARTIGLRS